MSNELLAETVRELGKRNMELQLAAYKAQKHKTPEQHENFLEISAAINDSVTLIQRLQLEFNK